MMEYTQEDLRREEDFLRKWDMELKEKEIEMGQERRGLDEWQDELEIERVRLQNVLDNQNRVRVQLNNQKRQIQEANVPVKEVLEEILLLLELEENPATIADKIRDRLGIIDVKW